MCASFSSIDEAVEQRANRSVMLRMVEALLRQAALPDIASKADALQKLAFVGAAAACVPLCR